jgi:DNA-binding MarR family transcriptional regulator
MEDRREPKPGGSVPARTRDARTTAIIDLLRAFSAAMERYIEVHGAAHGLHRTDLYALGHVMEAAREGRQLTPGELADALNLSSPATSALLARLEGVGHVRRSHSTTDRRRVSVEMTDEAMSVGRAIFMPLADDIAKVVSALSVSEQDTVLRFLAGVVDAANAGGAQSGSWHDRRRGNRS